MPHDDEVLGRGVYSESMGGVMWKLRPGWRAVIDGNTLLLKSDIRGLRITLPAEEQQTDISRLLQEGMPDHSPLVVELKAHRVLMRCNTGKEQRSGLCDYFFHLGLDGLHVRTDLNHKSVLLLGVGGTGSVVLQHLCGAGLRRFLLVDEDVVDESNLERQFIYDSSSVGRPKVAAAEEYILARLPGASVHALQAKIDHRALADVLSAPESVDLAVVCFDQPPAFAYDLATSVMWKRGVPCIHGGVLCRSGFYGPLFSAAHGSPPPHTFGLARSETGAAELSPDSVAFPPYNSIVGAHLAAETLHFLAGVHEAVEFRHRVIIDFSRLEYLRRDSRLS